MDCKDVRAFCATQKNQCDEHDYQELIKDKFNINITYKDIFNAMCEGNYLHIMRMYEKFSGIANFYIIDSSLDDYYSSYYLTPLTGDGEIPSHVRFSIETRLELTVFNFELVDTEDNFNIVYSTKNLPALPFDNNLIVDGEVVDILHVKRNIW